LLASELILLISTVDSWGFGRELKVRQLGQVRTQRSERSGLNLMADGESEEEE
jgi:hypothetical protein